MDPLIASPSRVGHDSVTALPLGHSVREGAGGITRETCLWRLSMRGLSRARWIAGVGIMALAVTACGGGDDNGGNNPSNGNTSAAAQGGTLNVYASEPAYLFP